MNNEHTHNPQTNVALLAANSLVINRKRTQTKRPKGNKPYSGRSIYNLTATPLQLDTDPRLEVIRDFLDIVRNKYKGSRTPFAREFIVNAIHDAIVRQAKIGSLNQAVIKNIEERCLRDVGDDFLGPEIDKNAIDV